VRRLDRCTKTSPYIGVEFTGVTIDDVRRPEVFDALVDALHQRDLVVVRNVNMTPEQQIELASRIGSPVPFVLKDWRHPEFDEILVSSNEWKNNKPLGVPRVGNFCTRTRPSASVRPSTRWMLHGVNVPQDCGHTLFASACDVYDRLPDMWQAKPRRPHRTAHADQAAAHRRGARRAVDSADVGAGRPAAPRGGTPGGAARRIHRPSLPLRGPGVHGLGRGERPGVAEDLPDVGVAADPPEAFEGQDTCVRHHDRESADGLVVQATGFSFGERRLVVPPSPRS
jgi:hypothetical protein